MSRTPVCLLECNMENGFHYTYLKSIFAGPAIMSREFLTIQCVALNGRPLFPPLSLG